MAIIGKVTVGSTTHQTVQIKQPQKTTIANPNLELKKPVLSLEELSDVTTVNVQDGYTLVYNSITGKYEAMPISNVDITITSVAGGVF